MADILQMLQESANAQKSFADKLREQRLARQGELNTFQNQVNTPNDFQTPGGVPLNPAEVINAKSLFAKSMSNALSPYSPELEQKALGSQADILTQIYQLSQADKKAAAATNPLDQVKQLQDLRKQAKDQNLDTSSYDAALKALGVDTVVTEKQETKDEVVKLAKEMLTDNSFWGGTKSISGLFQGFSKLSGTKAADIANKYETLKSLLTLENLDKMKGVLSDSDIKLLKQASSELNRTQSEGSFRKSLENLVTKLGTSESPTASNFDVEAAKKAGYTDAEIAAFTKGK